MIYVSIDIETSGLDHEKNKVLSIGAIIEDTEKKLPFEECPKFNAIILQNEIVGSPRALDMNAEIIHYMSEYKESNYDMKQEIKKVTMYEFLEEDQIAKDFYYFLEENGFSQGMDNSGGYVQIKDGQMRSAINGATKPITINVAGKNFATFDKLFLEQLPWWKKLIRIRQRVLDPAILMVDWNGDESLPNLTTCKERAGVSGIVTHNALEDAWDVIEILRKFY